MTTEQKQEVKEAIAVEMLEHRHAREIEAIKEEHNLAFKRLADFTKEQKKEYEIRIENLLIDLMIARKNETQAINREKKWRKAYEQIEEVSFYKERNQLAQELLQTKVKLKEMEDMFDEQVENNNKLLKELKKLT